MGAVSSIITLNQSTTRSHEGTGIGLALTREASLSTSSLVRWDVFNSSALAGTLAWGRIASPILAFRQGSTTKTTRKHFHR